MLRRQRLLLALRHWPPLMSQLPSAPPAGCSARLGRICSNLLGPLNPGQSSEHVQCYKKLHHPAGRTIQPPLRASPSAPQCSSISQLRPSISYPRTFALVVPAAVSTLPISTHRCVFFQVCVPKPPNLKGLLLKPSLKSPPDGTPDSPGLSVWFSLPWPRL